MNLSVLLELRSKTVFATAMQLVITDATNKLGKIIEFCSQSVHLG
jgi:hypothetical protein